MDLSSSPPLPIPTFQEGESEASPALLLEFLHQIRFRFVHDPSWGHTSIELTSWFHLFSTLSENFFITFPNPQELPWSTLHEKIALCETALDVICCAVEHIDYLLFNPEFFARDILLRTFKACAILDIWCDVPVPSEERYPSPEDLRTKFSYTCVQILHSLSCGYNSEKAKEVEDKATDKDAGKDVAAQDVNGEMNKENTKDDDKDNVNNNNVNKDVDKDVTKDTTKDDDKVVITAVDEDTKFVPRHFLKEFLAGCNDLLCLSPTTEFPVHMALFSTPRIADRLMTRGEQSNEFVIKLDSPSQVPILLTSILELCVNSIVSVLPSSWYILDLVLSFANICRQTFDFILSPACATTHIRRARSLRRLCQVSRTAQSIFPNFSAVTEYMTFRALLHRLQVGPVIAWEDFDSGLQQALVSCGSSSFSPDVHAVLTALRTENWGKGGNGIRALAQTYLCLFVPQLDEETLKAIRCSLSADQLAAIYHQLLREVDARLLSRVDVKPQSRDNELNELIDWRAAVKTNVQAIIKPIELAWMDDDASMNDTQYIMRAFGEVERRFERPLNNLAAEAREAIAQALGYLACNVVHGQQSACHGVANRPGISMLTTYMLVATRLLDGPVAVITPLVQKATYDALTRALRHHAAASNGSMDHIAELIVKGMKDLQRGVRLSAGRALVELVRLYQSLGDDVGKRTEKLFSMLYRLFDRSKDPMRETTLITLGLIGRIANPDVLGQTVCCLIAQLGRPNAILKGTTHMQLQTLARHYRRTPYRLVLPYLDQIAPFLVFSICAQPQLVVESCRFISVTTSDFIRFTLPRTLPRLFGSCDMPALEKVSKETGEKPHTLFINHSHTILAHTFLLAPPGHTKKVLNFIMSLLHAAVGAATIDIPSVVRSCIVPLLTELVIVLGDENQDVAGTAMSALRKVENYALAEGSSSRGLDAGNVGAFLKPYMLGIMTALNDFLQEPPTKRSPEFKKKILRSLGPFVTQIGPAVSDIAPQIMATLQTMLIIPELSDVTLQSWCTFLSVLDARDIGSQVGPTSASFVVYWSTFSHHGQGLARRCLESIIMQKGDGLQAYMDEFVNLDSIPELAKASEQLLKLRVRLDPRDTLERILERSASESLTVALQALRELKTFLLSDHECFVRALASGDVFDPLIGQITSTLFTLACRDGESTESLRALAFDCIGALGAVDPDRFEMGVSESRLIMLKNFTDESESFTFALHLIRDVLVSAFRSTSDIKYQNHLAYAIQELLRFCRFSAALVNTESTSSIPLKVRNRWNALPKYVLETVTPLLESRFNLQVQDPPPVQHPIYPMRQTYREWIQSWTGHLITRTSGEQARAIFKIFPAVVRNKDVGVAHHLLPHLVLNVLLSDNQTDAHEIRQELLSVLEDQVDGNSQSSADKKLLSAQTVFMLMDHLNQWVRMVRQNISVKKVDNKRARSHRLASSDEEQLLKIDSILSSIDQSLMAKAALQCKAYARSLMNFEQQVVMLRQDSLTNKQLHEYYERLHEIYANLDEPDGMAGVSTLIVSPSLEHQIRQHESTGRWTSAQSCWEVRLQHDPDNLDFHIGLLRCLRNLGHYDTLRTHVKGVLTRNPDWEPQLSGFQVESEWMVGNWAEVQTLVANTKATTSSILLAQVLLALRDGDSTAVSDALSNARRLLGAPILASGSRGYRRSYEAVLDLHLVHELEVIYDTVTNLPLNTSEHNTVFERLSQRLSARLDSTLPTFRTREPILSMRRTAFALSVHNDKAKGIIGHSWIASAKIARKAGHWQTAYSAMLQAQQYEDRFSFRESAKLVKANGEPLRALQELENSIRLYEPVQRDVIDLTGDPNQVNQEQAKRMKAHAKLHVLRARWMKDSDRFDITVVLKAFQKAHTYWDKWESGQFHLGQFQDECFKALTYRDQINRGTRMNLSTVRCFIKAAKYGSKYIYQTIPRLLTLWLDMGENPHISEDVSRHMNTEVDKAIMNMPVYKWFTAFPQIVSRVGHTNPTVYRSLAALISKIMAHYPKQAFWFFASVVKSKSASQALRLERGMNILNRLRSRGDDEPARLINHILRMTGELLALCDYVVGDGVRSLSMTNNFPKLFKLAPSPLLIPLQESLTVNHPPTLSGLDVDSKTFQAFPVDAPTFARFHEEIDVMQSVARPRKITIQGSNGQTYMFLGKPKDDLRKDARLMDFNAIINKLLKTNSESRKRQLRIRTYGVVTLNEECGFIQWVPNTIPVRPVLHKCYDRRGIKSWYQALCKTFEKIKGLPDNEVAAFFVREILSIFPPVFHEWFIETFPEPTAWLASRLAYSRTAAVMSMIGFILGLGDRHCENILLDTNTGDVVHVDFNCLFEKGKTLEMPERVPFRLTQNIVDGFGVTGVEGVFRIACEVTLQLLRDNKDCLMSVLDAFVHDPLVEWEDEKRKRELAQKKNAVRKEVNLRELAKGALNPIEKKLKGIYVTSRERREKEISTSNLVQMLIQEATDNENLGRMYAGWTPWH